MRMTPDPDDSVDLARRRALGEEFGMFPCEMKDVSLEPEDPGRRDAVARFRAAVERAAFYKIEVPLVWHSLATWTEGGKERIGYFSPALDCQIACSAAQPPRTAKERWSDLHMRGDCLYEIGRIHAHEGEPDMARGFFERALTLAREAEKLRLKCDPPITQDDRLEGQILTLLLQLPDAGETPFAA